MQEAQFIQQHADKWRTFEAQLGQKQVKDPEKLANLFIAITDDLAFARTHFPQGQAVSYLNAMAGKVYQEIHQKQRFDRAAFGRYWLIDLPLNVYQMRWYMLYSLLFFMAFVALGVLSSHHDENYVRIILGDAYVDQTLYNIQNGDPLAIYKQTNAFGMFYYIAKNNLSVAFRTFAAGILFSVGTVYILAINGVMLGTFQYMFVSHGLLAESVLTIWIHGTIEILCIVIAGGSGILLGSSWLFPGTYSRVESLKRGAATGGRVLLGLIPFIIVAAALESFATRHTEWPNIIRVGIILSSLVLMVGYFVYWPWQVARRLARQPKRLEEDAEPTLSELLAFITMKS
ncbi:stage II sporulation protein M [Eisenibacter elegans]|uniref:stage II sporulation protein M n=1 Tax=Eisenibacter elegans TaxID=997 RepID=UPI00040BA186|nr:stage II sporulation protein M [Eisenibacter elegans]